MYNVGLWIVEVKLLGPDHENELIEVIAGLKVVLKRSASPKQTVEFEVIAISGIGFKNIFLDLIGH